MISIEGKLGRLISEMSPAQMKAYRERSKGGETAECLLNVAESVIQDWPAPAARRIKRNNGASSYAESDPGAEADRIIEEAIGRRDPAFAKAVAAKESQERLTPKQEEQYQFCLAIRMSESDAMKVALSGD